MSNKLSGNVNITDLQHCLLISNLSNNSPCIDFVKFIQAYDMRRDKDFKETFPMYAHLLREWNV